MFCKLAKPARRGREILIMTVIKIFVTTSICAFVEGAAIFLFCKAKAKIASRGEKRKHGASQDLLRYFVTEEQKYPRE